MPDPETTKAASEWLSIGAKIGGLFLAFVSGIITATWAIARKVGGFDDRIKALEDHYNGQNEKIDRKLDRLHARIDEVILKGTTPVRHEHRDGDHDSN